MPLFTTSSLLGLLPAGSTSHVLNKALPKVLKNDSIAMPNLLRQSLPCEWIPKASYEGACDIVSDGGRRLRLVWAEDGAEPRRLLHAYVLGQPAAARSLTAQNIARYERLCGPGSRVEDERTAGQKRRRFEAAEAAVREAQRGRHGGAVLVQTGTCVEILGLDDVWWPGEITGRQVDTDGRIVHQVKYDGFTGRWWHVLDEEQWRRKGTAAARTATGAGSLKQLLSAGELEIFKVRTAHPREVFACEANPFNLACPCLDCRRSSMCSHLLAVTHAMIAATETDAAARARMSRCNACCSSASPCVSHTAPACRAMRPHSLAASTTPMTRTTNAPAAWPKNVGSNS